MHTFRRPRYHIRGAAMVEAVIALPVFILILLSVFYVRDQVLAQQQASTQARSCAWLYSTNNCTEVPVGCEGVLGEPTNGDANNPALGEALRGGATTALEGAGVSKFVSDLVGTILDPAIEAALGSSVPATATREVARPGLYGGGMKHVQGKYDLACNLAHTTPEKVANEAWSQLPIF